MKRLLTALMLILFLSPLALALPDGMQSQSSLVKFGEDIVIPAKTMVESVVAIGGSVTVAGNVKEDVVAIGGNVVIKGSANIGGDAVAIGGKVLKAGKGSVKGDVVEVGVLAGSLGKGAKIFALGGMIFSLLSFMGFLVLALIIVALFQKQLGKVSYYIEKETGHSIGWGIIGMIVIPFIIFLLIISLIGILFIPLFVMTVAAAIVFGYIAAGQLLGKRIIKAFKKPGQPMTTEVILGLILLYLVGLLPILGWIVQTAAIITGLGAVVRTRFGNT